MHIIESNYSGIPVYLSESGFVVHKDKAKVFDSEEHARTHLEGLPIEIQTVCAIVEEQEPDWDNIAQRQAEDEWYADNS